MLIDSLALDNDTLIESDIAIVGGGMAGICLAHEFKDSPLSICILESGGEQPDPQTADLNKGTAYIHGADGKRRRADAYMHESRERYFGGTGNAWGGKCAELDPFDFTVRPWINDSGWPLSYAEIKPYYDRACYMLHIPAFDSPQLSLQNPQTVSLNANRNFTTAFRLYTGITGNPMSKSFNEYKYSITRFNNTKTYLHANVVSLNTDANGEHIETLTLRCINQKRHSVKARYFILAAGGLENVRILLNSNKVHSGGIGNRHDLVGRFFNGHGLFRHLKGLDRQPAFVELMHDARNNLDFYIEKDPAKPQGIFSITQKAQWRERISHFTATLEPLDKPGASRLYPLFFMLEQYPNSESRIILSNEKDALDMPRLHLDWRFSQHDIDTLVKGIKLFTRDFEKTGLGVLSEIDVQADIADIMECSRHHMGCTRMHTSDHKGVVDGQAKVHDINNLYIAGSSVFPTGGIANPTLTILALTIRLADYIKKANEL